MSKRVFWGSALLLIGLLLLASNLGYLAPFSFRGLWPILIIWPTLRLIFGRAFVVFGDSRRRERLWVGSSLGIRFVAVWILAGAVAQLLHNLSLITYDWGFVSYWTLPVLLVGIGVVILARPHDRHWSFVQRRHMSGESWGNVSGLVGEVDIGRRPWDFKSPMRLDLWAGDINIDLTTARFQPGPNYLYVTAWAGDIDIQAPEGIEVVAEADCSAGQIAIFHRRRSGLGVGVKASRGAGGAVVGASGDVVVGASGDAAGGSSDDATVADSSPAASETAGEAPRLFIKLDLTFGDVRIR